jgi:hypothetical protein
VPSVPSGIGVARRTSITSPGLITGEAGIVIVVVPSATTKDEARNLGIFVLQQFILLPQKKRGDFLSPLGLSTFIRMELSPLRELFV